VSSIILVVSLVLIVETAVEVVETVRRHVEAVAVAVKLFAAAVEHRSQVAATHVHIIVISAKRQCEKIERIGLET
jgi:hypothetical protein